MRKWLLVDTHGQDVFVLGKVEIECFTSWDQAEPAPGDLMTAVEGLLARRETPPHTPPKENATLLLVPLEGGMDVEATRAPAWSISVRH